MSMERFLSRRFGGGGPAVPDLPLEPRGGVEGFLKKKRGYGIWFWVGIGALAFGGYLLYQKWIKGKSQDASPARPQRERQLQARRPAPLATEFGTLGRGGMTQQMAEGMQMMQREQERKASGAETMRGRSQVQPMVPMVSPEMGGGAGAAPSFTPPQEMPQRMGDPDSGIMIDPAECAKTGVPAFARRNPADAIANMGALHAMYPKKG